MAVVGTWALLSMSACNSDSAALPPAPLQPAVQQVGEMEYQVTRARLDAALEQYALDQGCRFVPHERAGKVVGVRVYGIRPGSFPRQFGIQNGDMIVDVNGFSVSSPDTVLRAYDEFHRSRDLTINFERHDTPMKLIVHVTAP